MKRKDEQAIDDTAGVAAGSLNDMLEKNLQSFSSLKADVTTADHSLMSAEEMLRKAQLALNAVPETFARIGAETINAFKDVRGEHRGGVRSLWSIGFMTPRYAVFLLMQPDVLFSVAFLHYDVEKLVLRRVRS